jgi:uncharacterized protein YcfL
MKKLLCALLCLGLLVGCSSGTSNNTSNTEEQSESVETSNDPKELIKEVNNWYVSDIWNDGLCDVSWYLSQGTSSTGEELDIEFTMRNLDKSMQKLDTYNDEMNALSDDWEDAKYTWSKMYGEIKRNYELIKGKELKANEEIEGFSTDKLTQYADKFYDLAQE